MFGTRTLSSARGCDAIDTRAGICSLSLIGGVFTETFSDAAVYAQPSECWDTVQGLWEDEQAWLEQANRGRDFVKTNCSYDQFLPRLLDK
ncbi:MAG: glycosyltransferase family 1 protein [Hyphomicrobiales bacterium]|nr:glycosyltransferase family 1 protein [Hyphomicrobiales bacterium]